MLASVKMDASQAHEEKSNDEGAEPEQEATSQDGGLPIVPIVIATIAIVAIAAFFGMGGQEEAHQKGFRDALWRIEH